MGFLTRYDRELREPLLWHQGSQVSMRVYRGNCCMARLAQVSPNKLPVEANISFSIGSLNTWSSSPDKELPESKDQVCLVHYPVLSLTQCLLIENV